MHVIATDIIGANTRVFSAWVPSSLTGDHSTLRSIAINGEPRWCGRVGTSHALPANVAALPNMSDERIAAVQGWYRTQFQQAYVAILEAHPEATHGLRRSGEIEIQI